MKIALLSGAVKNAGDFLITKRSIELLLDVLPNVHITTYIRNSVLSAGQVEEINGMDSIIIAGGPYYKWDLYPQSMPLVNDLSELKPKVFMMGGGWYGNTASPSEVFHYKFSEHSRRLLNRAMNDTRILGCRDFYAVKVLKANGINDVLMTGCPAWYDINKICERINFTGDVNKIAISDPADIIHFGNQSLEVAKYLKKRFPTAEIKYLFHRGMSQDLYTDFDTAKKIECLKKQLNEIDIPYYDIAYSDTGFQMYNDCDLHVGHRVHAHIYSLSQRICSILIEEDSRGAGANEALGLWGIKAYKRKKELKSSIFVKAYNKVFDYTQLNEYCIAELAVYIDYLVNSKADILNLSFDRMEYYYAVMRSHIAMLRDQLL